MKLTAVLFSILSVGIVTAQGPPWQAALSHTYLTSVPRVMIVQPIGQWTETKRDLLATDPFVRNLKEWPAATAEFRIVDSTTPGIDKVKVVIAGRLTETKAPILDPSKRWLLLATPIKDGEFWLTSGSSTVGWSARIKAGTGDDLAALLILPTMGEKLPQGMQGADQVTAAILDCLDPASDDSHRNMVKLLSTAHPEWKYRPDALVKTGQALVPYAPDGPLVKLIREKLRAAKTPYRRSKVLELMLRWRVPGSLEQYVRSLEPLLKEAQAYGHRDDNQLNWGLIEDLHEFAGLDGQFNYSMPEFLAHIEMASNAKLVLYWLSHFGGVMDEPQLKRFAMLLDFKDRQVQFRAATILASQLNDPDHAPKEYAFKDDREVPYPDLDEKVAYWKKRLGLTRLVMLDRLHAYSPEPLAAEQNPCGSTQC